MSAAREDAPTVTLYEYVGGMPFFDGLVERFYAGVADDPVLLRLYPDQVDLVPARERLSLFLAQYFGGPTTYSDRRGHPRLRMRHVPYAIGPSERDHWLGAMRKALDDTTSDGRVAEEIWGYLTMAAEAMRIRE